MDAGSVLTRTARVWLRDDGLIQAVVFPNRQPHGLEAAKENMAAIAGFAADKKRPVLIDMRAIVGINREARAYYADGGGRRVATAAALLIGSPVSRVIANFLISLNRPPIPIQLFTSEAEAVAWLKQFSE
jgi:hypothetical protein